MSKDLRPKVGVGVIIHRDGNILIGKRISPHGINTWAPPGGHLEYGESPAECAHRELLEETGTILLNARLVPSFTNDIFKEKKKHYITLWVVGECVGEPKLIEPDTCECWEWHDWDNLPSPMFLSLVNLKKQGYHPLTDNSLFVA